MRRIPSVGLVALLGTGACYSYVEQPSMLPQWDPAFVSGPPGGAMDPGYGYRDPIYTDPAAQGAEGAAQPIDPAGSAPGSELGAAEAPGEAPEAGAPEASGEVPEPSTDPADPGYAIGSVTDAEIDATLSPYGQWVETEEYGRVWRPDATVVGVDFTPYESCGAWVYTEHGWTFTCEWDWGWLPFHYGQWAWLDDAWCWVRDYTWSPAWVEWRSGGGYVGWRPLAPRIRDHRRGPGGGGGSGGGPVVRDHRDHRGGKGPIVRDHRKPRESDWRFAHERDFGRTKIRPGLYKNVAEGIRITSNVSRPPVRGTRVSAAEVMRPRIHARFGVRLPSATAGQPARGYQQPARGYQPPSRGSYQPTRPARPAMGTYSPPSRGTYSPPSRGTDAPPRRGFYQPPIRRHYSPPSRGTDAPPRRGFYQPPIRKNHASPSGGSYSPPSRGSYSPPSRSSGGSYSPPSRSSGGSYSRPSRSSGSSYSPSRSSSSSSRGSSSSPSRSSSSSSRGSSSSSSSSRSSSGGGGRRR